MKKLKYVLLAVVLWTVASFLWRLFTVRINGESLAVYSTVVSLLGYGLGFAVAQILRMEE